MSRHFSIFSKLRLMSLSKSGYCT